MRWGDTTAQVTVSPKWRWLGRDTEEPSDRTQDPDSKSQDWTVSSLSGSKKDKLCLVCGDKALGYNFNAVSCESCKAFFRRNAHKTIRGRCEGKCDVNVESRSFCKRCRLHKCFTVGMRRDMILNEQQKKVRKQKIIINKLKKHGQLPVDESDATTSEELSDKIEARIRSQSLEELRTTFPNLSEKDLEVLMKLKQENIDKQDEFSCSRKEGEESYPPWTESQTLVQDVIGRLPEMQRSLLLELQRANEQSSFLGHTQTEIKGMPTNTAEFINIAEGLVRRTIKLAKNIEFFKMISKEDQIALLKGSVVEIMMLRSAINYDVEKQSWSLSTRSCLSKDKSTSGTDSSDKNLVKSPLSINLPQSSDSNKMAAESHGQKSETEATRQDIPVVKRETKSDSLPSCTAGTGSMEGLNLEKIRDQFRNGANLSELRAQFGGKMKSESPGEQAQSKVGSDLLKFGNSETRAMFMSYATFIKSLMKTIHGDVVVLKILVMLSLFSSDRQGLDEKHKIEEIQECYAQILQIYLSHRFPHDKTLFARVLMKLTDLRDINELHTKMLLKMKVDSIEPLLVEIFDLPL